MANKKGDKTEPCLLLSIAYYFYQNDVWWIKLFNIWQYKERRRCEDNHGEKIAMMQQCSTEYRSAVDLRRRLTNFKMSVSQSVSQCEQSWDSLSNHSNNFGFSTSQGSVAKYCRWAGNLCDREFSYEWIIISERISKIDPRLPKLLSNVKGLTFLRHSVCYVSSTAPASKQSISSPVRPTWWSVLAEAHFTLVH